MHLKQDVLGDFHKVVMTCFKSTYEKLQKIKSQYRSYKNFNEDMFLSDLRSVPFEHVYSLPDNMNWHMESSRQLFSEVVDKHAPLKHRVLRRNQAPFMTRDLSKQIMIRSRLRNKFNKFKNGLLIKLSEINVCQ